MADRTDRKSFNSDSKTSLDEPPNSRLFILSSKQLVEEDFRNAFSKFGEIEEVWVVKDRHSGERKGVTYIKYTKTSAAAAALEAMNGKVIGNTNRRIKVMIAASPDQGSKRDGNEEEKTLRLFVIVQKTMTDEQLYNIFKVYGDIDYAIVIKDKETRENKGFAYIKYFKFSHAAAAYEQCDRKFKAVFAEPRKSKQQEQQPERTYSNSFDAISRPTLSETVGEGYLRLQVFGSPQLNQDQLWKLFDIVPGMDYCQLKLEGRPRPVRSIATVVYNNPQAASYACNKLHGFEYPPGSRLIVKPECEVTRSLSEHSSTSSLSRATSSKPDLLQLAETIAQATCIIQAAGISPDLLQSQMGLNECLRKNDVFCNIKLPEKRALAPIDAHCEARCFIVCTPTKLPATTLRDVFCRFGDLIDVYMLYNRNCGYAKFASKHAAQNAIAALHGVEVCGIRIKVMEAEERNNDRKRLRLDDEAC